MSTDTVEKEMRDIHQHYEEFAKARLQGVNSERDERIQQHNSEAANSGFDDAKLLDSKQLYAREMELRRSDEDSQILAEKWFQLGQDEERLAWRKASESGKVQERLNEIKKLDSQPESLKSESESDSQIEAEVESKSVRAIAFDVEEMFSPELARGPNGELMSTFSFALVDPHFSRASSYPAGRSADPFSQYVKHLRNKALCAESPELRERFDLQARFEESRSPQHRGQHQADLAKLDLRFNSAHQDTAMARLQKYSIEPRSIWARATYEQSDLRSSLPAWEITRYDTYRNAVSEKLARRDGKSPDGYIMKPEDTEFFDRSFEKFTVDVLRQSKQRQAGISVGTGGDVNGLADKPGDTSRVPREVDIPGYRASRAEDGRSIDYRARDEDEVSFRDAGERISVAVSKRTDPKVLRSSLAIASKRYERISLNGSQEFRQAAAREAVQMGIDARISNPELKNLIKQEQDRLRENQITQGRQQPLSANASATESQALNEERGEQAERQGIEATSSEAQHHELGAEAGSDRVAESSRNDDMPVMKIKNNQAKGTTLGGTEEMPVLRAQRKQSASAQLDSEDMPVQRVPIAHSNETISAKQESGGVRLG